MSFLESDVFGLGLNNARVLDSDVVVHGLLSWTSPVDNGFGVFL